MGIGVSPLVHRRRGGARLSPCTSDGNGFNIHTIGTILLVVGAIGAIFSDDLLPVELGRRLADCRED